jgi:cation/acetate symporter
MIQDVNIDFHWFPLENPGIVAIPAAFLLGWLFSVLPSRARKENKWIGAEMEVRSLTGFGAEKATDH